jgi:uncharacterized damage-inducible protein DinB
VRVEQNVAAFYEGWRLGNDELIAALEHLSAEQLQLPVGSPTWPIWASASHLAGMRVYWLCHVFKEPGAETTPFTDPGGVGWEDDLSHPRGADELVGALRSSWAIVEHTLAAWTPDSLTREARRVWGDKVQIHTRQSVLMRMITHDAFHSGEISLALGSNGLGAIDMWKGLSRVVPS